MSKLTFDFSFSRALQSCWRHMTSIDKKTKTKTKTKTNKNKNKNKNIRSNLVIQWLGARVVYSWHCNHTIDTIALLLLDFEVRRCPVEVAEGGEDGVQHGDQVRGARHLRIYCYRYIAIGAPHLFLHPPHGLNQPIVQLLHLDQQPGDCLLPLEVWKENIGWSSYTGNLEVRFWRVGQIRHRLQGAQQELPAVPVENLPLPHLTEQTPNLNTLACALTPTWQSHPLPWRRMRRQVASTTHLRRVGG